MPQEIFQVDAFTDRPFAGNPAAVCILDKKRSDEWMQSVAAEMNLSETAFLVQRDDKTFDLRWFTPVTEVDLCGHATLASAHILFQENHLLPSDTARFHTRSGVLTARRAGTEIELDFPAKPETRVEDKSLADALTHALGIEALYVGKNDFDFIAELESEEAVRAVAPDFTGLKALNVRGVIVTARAGSNAEYDFVSRFFAPGSGIDEDPVTGSAHCCLAKFWSERLNKKDFIAFQASARGGRLRVTLDGDRVRLGGQAVTVMRGTLFC